MNRIVLHQMIRSRNDMNFNDSADYSGNFVAEFARIMFIL